MTPDRYAPAAAARRLGVGESTLRRWAATFAGFLSAEAQRARDRRYTAADLATLEHVRDLLRAGHSSAQVAAVLAGGPAIQFFRTGEAGDLTAPPVPPVSEIAAEVAALRAQVQAHAADLDALRRYLAGPWYRRLLGRPPAPLALPPPRRDDST